ncbi:YqeB family protein [Nonomuraea endophytica]|uniref:YqeB family protein n=1 Tax=Nonomuraea endophytica TaxID=714136 RepID=UPI0037C5D79E
MPASDQTVVTIPALHRVLVWVGGPLLGAGVLWLVKALIGWAATWPWVPFEKPVKLLAGLAEPYATAGALGLGAVGGLVLAFLIIVDHLGIAVDDTRAVFTHGERRWEALKADAAAVFLDGEHVVVQGHRTEELVRTRGDLPRRADIERAFLARGYPWVAGDPARAEFRLWADGHPDLDAAAHAFLRARQVALEKDRKDDADELRAELARLDLVVREEGKKQYWRRLPSEL